MEVHGFKFSVEKLITKAWVP